MSQIHKRYVKTHEATTSPKKCKILHKTDENLEDLKLKIERILNAYPISNKTSAQNISVVGTCPVTNTEKNYFTFNQANLIKIPLITSPTYQNNYSESSNNNTQSLNKNTSIHSNLIYLTGAPNTANNNSDLSETDLQVLLQNFYKLEGQEQQMLISHLKKLEGNKPDVVQKLKKFVRVSSPELNNVQEGDAELNDLDDLDDILEETDKLFTDSDSEDDCVVIDIPQVLETEKISEILAKSAENSLVNRKEQNSTKGQQIQINLLSNHSANKEPIGNRLTSNKIDNLNKTDVEKKSPTKYLERTKRNKRTNCLNVNLEKSLPIKLNQNKTENLNSFKQNWNKINSERTIELESAIDQEMQAKYFGYRNYEEMKQYLEKTGIYCDRNSYFSFSDNA